MNSNASSFDDATENFADWMRLHATKVAVGVGAVVILAGGIALWRGSAASRARRADTALFEAQGPLMQGNLPAAQQQLQQVAQRYDGTAAGAQAQMVLAQTYFEQGNFQKGLEVLAQAEDAPATLQNGVRRLQAIAYESMGQYDRAAKTYEAAATGAESDTERNQYKADAARAYQYAGNRDAALKLWTELSKLEGQGLADEAKVRVGELSVRPAR